MPKYEVTVALPTLGKGAPVNVPPLGNVENETVNEVYLSKENAAYLDSNEFITVKKLPDLKPEEVEKLAAKANTIDEIDLLFVGEERASVVNALTARKVELSDKAVAGESPVVETAPQDSVVAVQETPTEGGAK